MKRFLVGLWMLLGLLWPAWPARAGQGAMSLRVCACACAIAVALALSAVAIWLGGGIAHY